MSKRFSWFAGVGSAAVGMLITAGIAYAMVPTFSQTNVTIGLGQSTSVAATNGVSLYLLSNSAPTVATVSINGTSVTATGQALGSASVSVCAVGTASDCTTLNITVQAATVSGISFSQSNLSLSINNNQSVTVSGGNGTYSVTNNSNTSVVSTNLSGNTLTVSGLAVGGATITVCDTANTCGTLSVTISSTSSSSGLTMSQTSLSLQTGGSQVITVSGGTGSYHVSNNSNSTAVSAGLSGTNGVTVYALAAGSATITACDTSNLCGTVTVTVTAPTVVQAVTFSVANPTLTVGQTLNVALSGSNAPSYVILSNSNTSAVQASISGGNALSLTGVSAGTGSLTVCATGGGCDPISVTVTGPVSTPTTTTTPTTVVTTPVTTTVTQTATPVTTPVSVVANSALLNEIQTLQSAVTQILTQIQSVQTQLNQLQAQVSAGSGSSVNTNVSASATNVSSGTSYNFTELLTAGSSDAEVTVLQQRLTTLGFYSGPITGFYGSLTGQAVSKYQVAHGITATGYVGPSTRAALNAGN